MTLADEYRRQFAWRPWPAILECLPELRDRRIVDLGCGPGDLAAELAARGARVLAIDAHDELLQAARDRRVTRVELLHADLRALDELPGPAAPVDGLWCSFAAAYFPDLASRLAVWRRWLAPGGWLALTEIDDLFAHEPLAPATRARLDSYADEALRAGRYDFRMGRRLATAARAAGFTVELERRLTDAELAFDGPAPADVLSAWRARLDRMTLLHASCGAAWPACRDDFLAALARPDHRSGAAVAFVLARA